MPIDTRNALRAYDMTVEKPESKKNNFLVYGTPFLRGLLIRSQSVQSVKSLKTEVPYMAGRYMFYTEKELRNGVEHRTNLLSEKCFTDP